jgi:hypothetical protein
MVAGKRRENFAPLGEFVVQVLTSAAYKLPLIFFGNIPHAGPLKSFVYLAPAG